MKTEIKKIIKRKLKLKNFVNPSSIQSDFENGFYLNLLTEDKTLSFKLHFKNRELEVDSNKIISKSKHNIDIIKTIKKEEELNKKNANFLNENLSYIAKFNEDFFHFLISDSEYHQNQDYYKIDIYRMYYFDLNKNAKDIFKELSDEIVEYYVRDYMFIEKGVVLNNTDIQYFINAFYKTKCSCPFGDKDEIFSDEFKNFLAFENENEFNNTIELLKINYSF